MGGDGSNAGKRHLSGARQRLLAARLARAARGSRPERRVPEALNRTRFPATSSQTRFWFLNELDSGDPAYNMHVALEISGELDRARLERALGALLERHPVLGSRLERSRGKLWNNADAAVQLPLRIHPRDASSEPESLLIRLVREPFRLDAAPLLRAHLVELAPERHVLLLVVHHIVCDEPSLDILLRDLGTCYDDPARPAPADDVRFADYAVWCEERVPSVIDEQLPYWKGVLAGLEARTGVERDRSSARSADRRGRILRKQLPATVLADAQSFTAGENTTLFSLMATAWFLLLYRYGGNRDIAVGTPASMRTLADLNETVGLFLNTLVLRTKVDPAQTFRQLFRSVRDMAHGAFSHQEVPFESVVSALNPERSAGENPFFDTMIVQDSAPPPVPGFSGLDVERRMLDAEVCKFDLTLFFRDTPDGLQLSIEYDTALYSATRIEALLGHYAALLVNGVANPETPAGSIPYLRESEETWLRHTSAGPWQDVDDSPLVAAAVEANLRALDDRIAVIDEKGSVSYRELDKLVDNLAARMRRTNPRPQCVAVLLDRGRWAIGAMLAAWRIGACYVPLDPTYPRGRIHATLAALRDNGFDSLLVITTASAGDGLPNDVPTAIVDEPQQVVRSVEHSAAAIRRDDTAYIVFTSGSTGTPKGVRITHENLRVSTVARRQVYGRSPSCFLLVSPLAFDSSVAGLYWTLLEGGTLVIPSAGQSRDARVLATLIGQHRVTHTLMLPTLYALLLRSGGDVATLDTVAVAGEACPASLFRRHADTLPDARLFNEYGPSEATVWATVHQLDGLSDEVPIGRPIPSMRAFVLDDNRRPRPPGYAGELCLSGPALSPGYLDSAQDGGAFVDTEILGDRHRIYCTGDRVRWDEQGRLLFLGRIDDQVKVRGHRVELEDINSTIARQSDVLEAATVYDPVREALTAFVVAADATHAADRLAAALRAELPEYMIPARIVDVRELPRLPNGKLDASRLSAMQATSIEDEASQPGPLAAPDYLRLKQLWCRCLELDDCGPQDDFFDLGGHSLKALQLLLDVEDVFGKRLPLPALYANATLTDLHARLHDYASHDDGEILYPAKLSGSAPPLFIALAPLEQLVGKIDDDLPLLGLYHGINPPPGPDVTVEAMAERYLAALRRHQPQGPYRLAGYSFGCTLVLEIVHQLLTLGEPVERVILLDPPPPVPEGDLRFRTTRVINRIRSAGSLPRQAAFALTEARRIGGRVLLSVQRRLHRGVSEAAGRVPSRAALIQAGVDWSRGAARNYQYKRCPAPVLFVMPERREVSVAGQLDRWDGLLTGTVDVLTLKGPEHQELLQEPWVSEIGAAINELLVTKKLERAGAA